MINAPVKIEWNDAKSDYMIGGMTMQQYGFRYGVENFGGVRPRQSVHVGGGVYWDIPGGIGVSDSFTYAELVWMKEQGFLKDVEIDFGGFGICLYHIYQCQSLEYKRFGAESFN